LSRSFTFFTGSIARSATRRYLIYSEAYFELFRPAGPLLRAKFRFGFVRYICNSQFSHI